MTRGKNQRKGAESSREVASEPTVPAKTVKSKHQQKKDRKVCCVVLCVYWACVGCEYTVCICGGGVCIDILEDGVCVRERSDRG